jgi:hypothetical protein
VYPVIDFPPVALAVNVTFILPVADVLDEIVPIVGACGTVVAVIEFDAPEFAEGPTEFDAYTVKVYAVFDCNPVTVKGDDAPVAVYPPGEDVAVNEVAAAPVAAGVKVTVAAPLLYARLVPISVAVPIVGALGFKNDLTFCAAVTPIILISFLPCI